MERYVSEPIPLPRLGDPAAPIGRADLVFYDIDPKGPSDQARIYLNLPDADHATPRVAASGFAGWFTIFGHGGCFGDDERHCEHPEHVNPFDLRPPRGIPPQTKTVTVTDAMRALRRRIHGHDRAGDRDRGRSAAHRRAGLRPPTAAHLRMTNGRDTMLCDARPPARGALIS